VLGIALLAVVFSLFWLRDARAPRAARLFMALQIVPALLLVVAGPQLPPGYEGSNALDRLGIYAIVGALAANAVWQPYFARARRVRVTYAGTLPRRLGPAAVQFGTVLAGVVAIALLAGVTFDTISFGSLQRMQLTFRVLGDGTAPASAAQVQATAGVLQQRLGRTGLVIPAEVRPHDGAADQIEVVIAVGPSATLPDANWLVARRGVLECRGVVAGPDTSAAAVRDEALRTGEEFELLPEAGSANFYACVRTPALQLEQVREARVTTSADGKGALGVRLGPETTVRLRDFSVDLVGSMVAIIFDGVVLGAPTLRDPLTSGAFDISGLDMRQAVEIGNVLRLGAPLPHALALVDRSAGPASWGWLLHQGAVLRRVLWIVLLAGALVALVAAWRRLGKIEAASLVAEVRQTVPSR
jgi:hypothetical protein